MIKTHQSSLWQYYLWHLEYYKSSSITTLVYKYHWSPSKLAELLPFRLIPTPFVFEGLFFRAWLISPKNKESMRWVYCWQVVTFGHVVLVEISSKQQEKNHTKSWKICVGVWSIQLHSTIQWYKQQVAFGFTKLVLIIYIWYSSTATIVEI